MSSIIKLTIFLHITQKESCHNMAINLKMYPILKMIRCENNG